MSAVSDLQDFLLAEGLVNDAGQGAWPTFRRRVTDASGDQLVVLTEDGGPQPPVGSAEETLQVQVLVRGRPNDGDSVEAKIAAIYDAVHGQTGVVMGETRYIGVVALSAQPAAFSDDKGRWNMTISFAMTRPQATP